MERERGGGGKNGSDRWIAVKVVVVQVRMVVSGRSNGRYR